MAQYLLPFILTFFLSAILTQIIYKLSFKWGFFDYPATRKIHRQPIPRLGGIAIFGSFFLVVLAYLVCAPEKLQFVQEKIWGVDKNLLGVLLGGGILVAAGIYDDIKGLAPGTKLAFQFLAGVVVALFGIRIWWFSNPFGSHIILGAWSPIFVILWILLLANVMNWLDGLDGLATGVSVIATIILFFLALQPQVNQPATALLALIVAGAAFGFLPFNFNPAKIFLGDAGAMFLGFMLAVFAIISGGKVATAFLVLGIPIFDAIWVIFRRLYYKKAPWRADRRHLHHRFLEAGFSQRQAVLFLYLTSATLGILALHSNSWGKFWVFLGLLSFMIILAFVLIFLEKRRKDAKQNN